jgi:hypothetical protein
MTRSWGFRAGIAAALAAGSGQLHAQVIAVHLDKPQVRLWYQESGRLSDDISPPRPFILWNTIIGEGDAEEHADDALFTIEVSTAGEQSVSQPLTLTATDKGGKILAQRTFKSVLTSEAGRAVLPLWVRDIGCAGTVIFSAKTGSEHRSFSMQFPCGE